ncbi:MAG TPA: tryptophan synthase subunit alpha [Chloroflexota bacterium]|nr:tryptophan synthase subunit alpha [Chloroflexota bacterium]
MNRIDTAFAALRARGEMALLPYLSVGFPARGETAALALELVRAGADGLELGIPFSDPLADGATLQRVNQQALDAGFRLADAFATAREIRAATDVPLVFMSYYNPVQHYGLEGFCTQAAGSGVDGLIVPDLPVEEAETLRVACGRAGLQLITMLAPTTPDGRMAAACTQAEGFIYCVSVVGVTGARTSLADELPAFLRRVRRYTAVPLVVGFGIARPEHVAAVREYADGAIVASALVDLLRGVPADERAAVAARYIAEMKGVSRGEVAAESRERA